MNKIELASKIKALLAKTVDNGCTEAEAMSAAIKAKQLMDDHQITFTDLDFEAEGVVRGKAEGPENRKINLQDRLAGAVAAYCDVKHWHKSDGYRQRTRVIFFGLRSDVEFANWLLKALEAFTWQQADQFGGSYFQRRDFARGCVNRITQRLCVEVAARNAQPTKMSDGRSLVVVKNAVVERAFKATGIKIYKGSASGVRRANTGNAYSAGEAAGNRAGFGRPVNGGDTVHRIG